MSPFLFVVLALVAYRLTRLVTRDSIWEGTRDRIGARWVGRGTFGAKMAELITCPFCAGVWVSLAVTVFVANLMVPFEWEEFVLIWWGLAGAQAVLASVDDRLNG